MCSERKDDEKLASHQTIRRTNIYLNSYLAGALSCELMGCCFEDAASLQPGEHSQVVNLVIVIQWKGTITNIENETKRQATAGSESVTLRNRWPQT